MMENIESKYGLLLGPSVKLSRLYFRETVKLLGIYVLYRSPKANKHWTTYGEIESNYNVPIKIGCLFHEHPDQRTLKRIGWVAELQENASLIEVDYDLPELQVGALFIIPSGLDDGKGRLFRVSSMKTSMVYPSSITCEIVPEYYNTESDEKLLDYSLSNKNFIEDSEDNYNSYLLNHDFVSN